MYMKTKAYLIVSTLIFTVVAIMHLLRLTLGWSVMLGMTAVPFWVSVLALMISAAVALWGLSLVRRI